MNVIQKTIMLEPAKSRNENVLPHFTTGLKYMKDNSISWGGYPVDIILDENQIKTLEGMNCLSVGSYEIGEYIVEETDSGDTEIYDDYYYNTEDDTTTNEYTVTTNTGDIVLRYSVMNELYAWLKKFMDECVFYKLCKRKNINTFIKMKDVDFFNTEYVDMLTEIPYTSEYTLQDIICIHELAEEYKEKFIIDGVDKSYDFFTMVNSFYENSNVYKVSVPYCSIPLYIDTDVASNGDFIAGITQWKPFKKYYIGNFVEYEDEIYKLVKTHENSDYYDSEKLDEEHWEKFVEQHKEIDCVSLSELERFKYKRTSLTDDNKILDFNLTDDGQVNLNYQMGISNVVENVDKKLHADYMEDVQYSGNVATFTYYTGCELYKDEDGNYQVDTDTGVKFVEQRPYEEKTETYLINDKRQTVTFKAFSDTTVDKIHDESDIPSAQVTYKVTTTAEEYFANLPFVKYDTINVSMDSNDNVNVDFVRGQSSAFEYHNILSEINSVEELESYRSDIFNAKEE